MKQQIWKVIPKRSPVLWANLGKASDFLGRLLPTSSPPLLILSLPRSGSSWVGDVLGFSSTSLYLREPITQTYMASTGHSLRSFFEIIPDKLPPTYKSAADAAFAGLPIFPSLIVQYHSQWSLSRRKSRRLVIKEVNPLAVEWIIDSYKPRVIYLIRHPVAVANSFFKLGWVGKQFESRFSGETLSSRGFNYERFTSSFWAEFGALEAVILNITLQALKGHEDNEVVKYEDLAANPIEVYRKLYTFAELEWDSKVERQIVERSTSTNQEKTGSYSVYRNSQAMIDKWKSEMSPKAVEEIKRGYFFYDPPYYRSEDWW